MRSLKFRWYARRMLMPVALILVGVTNIPDWKLLALAVIATCAQLIGINAERMSYVFGFEAGLYTSLDVYELVCRGERPPTEISFEPWDKPKSRNRA